MGKTIILISCSNRKYTDKNEEYYSEKDSILSLFSQDFKKRIQDKRYNIFNLIKEGKIEDRLRGDGNRKRGAYNLELQKGPDLLLNCSANNKTYLPAYKRYCQGRFFANAGQITLEEAVEHDHHTLIVSGLYGLITLREPIQSYGCHLDDIIESEEKSPIKFNRLADLWEDVIYDSLIEYIECHNAKNKQQPIERIIDLLSEYSYQRVFYWNKPYFNQEINLKIYHRVYPAKREPEFLPELGDYYKEICNKDESDLPIAKTSGPIFFTNTLRAEPYLEEKLKTIMSEQTWNMLRKITQEELIQGERLYELFIARGQSENSKVDRNIHFFIALEAELGEIIGEIPRYENNPSYYKLGTIRQYSTYINNNLPKFQRFKRGSFRANLEEVAKIRNNFSHYGNPIYSKDLIRARKLIIETESLLDKLMIFKRGKRCIKK